MISSSSICKTILVTGSNKGIGFGIIRGLLQKNNDYNIILTARSEERGLNSLKILNEEFKDKSDKLFYHQLDITDKKSIDDCISWVKSKFGQIDILVNNAAVATKGSKFDVEVFDFTFPTNVYGTIDLTEQAIDQDLIAKNGKIVILGSSIGNLRILSDENLKNEFKADNLTKEGLLDLAERFKQAIIDNAVKERGWPETAYGVSKIIINTYARVLSNRNEIIDRNISVFTCNPGWVRTDMAGPKAHLSVEEGVITPIYLIELGDGINPEYQGKYFDLCKVTSFYQ